MKPEIWGPHFWFTIHTIAMEYPENPSERDKSNYRNFFANLDKIIPCKSCKEHYGQNYLKLPIDNYLENDRQVFTWTVKLHNAVNLMKNSKQLNPNTVWEEYKKIYENEDIAASHKLFQYGSHSSNKDFSKFIFLGVGILIGYFLCSYFSKQNSLKFRKSKSRR